MIFFLSFIVNFQNLLFSWVFFLCFFENCVFFLILQKTEFFLWIYWNNKLFEFSCKCFKNLLITDLFCNTLKKILMINKKLIFSWFLCDFLKKMFFFSFLVTFIKNYFSWIFLSDDLKNCVFLLKFLKTIFLLNFPVVLLKNCYILWFFINFPEIFFLKNEFFLTFL